MELRTKRLGLRLDLGPFFYSALVMTPKQPKITPISVELEIDRFPPQSNNCYSQSRTGRRFPTKELIEFKSAVAALELWHNDFVTSARQVIKGWISNGSVLKVERVFFFPKKRVFSKAGKIMRCDLTNRIKATDDAVGDLLGFDDSYIFHSVEEKFCDSEDGLGRVWISISPILP